MTAAEQMAAPLPEEAARERDARVVASRRARVAALLIELPDVPGCQPGIVMLFWDRGDVEIVKGLLHDLAKRAPDHAVRARVALDALGALWAVL